MNWTHLGLVVFAIYCAIAAVGIGFLADKDRDLKKDAASLRHARFFVFLLASVGLLYFAYRQTPLSTLVLIVIMAALMTVNIISLVSHQNPNRSAPVHVLGGTKMSFSSAFNAVMLFLRLRHKPEPKVYELARRRRPF